MTTTTTTPQIVQNAMPGNTLLLTLLGVGIGVLGLLASSQANVGPSIVAFGCLLAIWARIVQAAAHHRDVMTRP